MSPNWLNHNKKLRLSDAKNTREMDAFLSKQKSSETSELKVSKQMKIGHRVTIQ